MKDQSQKIKIFCPLCGDNKDSKIVDIHPDEEDKMSILDFECLEGKHIFSYKIVPKTEQQN